MEKKKLHYGWIILAITVLNLLTALGFGRFSLAAILPFMKDGLTLSYSETGFVASGVFFGYLISAATVGYFIQKFSGKPVIIVSLFILTGGMLISAFSFNFWSAYIASFVTGLGSGGANVTSVGLVGRWFTTKYRGMALGITNSGSGLGMVFSGFVVPMLMVFYPISGWRISWALLAVIAMIILLLNVFFLKENPEDKNLVPYGADKYGDTEVKGTSPSSVNQNQNHVSVYKNKVVWLIGMVYFLWGFSYLIFSTFYVDFLITDISFDSTTAGHFFAIGGIFSIISGFIWGTLSDRIGRLLTLSLVFLIQGCILILFIFSTNSIVLLFETIVYGITLWAFPSIIIAAVNDLMAKEKAGTAIGFVTLLFGFGQLLSPPITGYLIELTTAYSAAFLLSSFACGVGMIGCLFIHFRYLKIKSVTEEENPSRSMIR